MQRWDTKKMFKTGESRKMLDSRSQVRQKLIALSITIAVLGSAVAASAQNRVDLDDLTIKGELLNDNRLRLSSRDQHQINDRVSYRTNFRKEIVDGLEIPWPDQDGRGPASQGAGGGQ